MKIVLYIIRDIWPLSDTDAPIVHANIKVVIKKSGKFWNLDKVLGRDESAATTGASDAVSAAVNIPF